MKRSSELVPLSRDHHQALYAALVLRRADEETLGTAVKRFLEFWRGHGARHFEIEEAVLLPGFARGGGDPRDRLVARVLTDHVEIRARAGELEREPTLEAAQELGKLVAAHVRTEEDELFPLIEETLAPEALAELGAAIEAAEEPSRS